MMQEKNHKLSDPGVCLFLLSAPVRFSLRGTGGGVLLAQLRCELVQVLLCFLLPFDERLEEAHFCGRRGLRPHGHGLDVFLERFALFKECFLRCR